ncbi:hypothetical protein [Egicoccus halophilus]|uniref:Uncharacterized protein n=1 Tax=Egicoccus halophilus TaxID=1670830 RepID=A0A8J3EVV6_9ACTN|nr:hypothetical protein [Egicoccus halophilus]GGI08915.1 hypothetical protein GCM10011354_31470 [Egicoccus halophilus]
MHPATSRSASAGWRGAVTGIALVVAATAVLGLVALGVAALAAGLR